MATGIRDKVAILGMGCSKFGERWDAQAALAAVRLLLEDPGVLKVGHNIKYDWLIFAQHGVEIRHRRLRRGIRRGSGAEAACGA